MSDLRVDTETGMCEYREYDDAHSGRGFRGMANDGGHALVSSTTRIDLHGTILLSAGADITRMESHPAIFLNHKYNTGWFGGGNQMDTLPIGRHLPGSPRQTKTEITSRVGFDTDSPDDDRALRARVIEDQVSKRMLTGVSISFRSKINSEWIEMRADDLCKETGLSMEDFGLEGVDDGERIPVMPEWHLIESSVVTVPSNPGGVIRSAGARNHLGKALQSLREGDYDEATREFDTVGKQIREYDNGRIRQVAGSQITEEGHQTSTSLSAPPGGWDEAGFRQRIEPVVAEMIDERLSTRLKELGLRAEEVAEPVTHTVPPEHETSIEEIIDALGTSLQSA